MFGRGNRKKRQELAAWRERVESAQRRLGTYASDGAFEEARNALDAARRAEERGDEDAARAYEDAWRRTVAVRGALARHAPERAAALLLDEAEAGIEELEGLEALGGWLQVLDARLEVGDAAGAERLWARRGELALDAPALLALGEVLFRSGTAPPWLGAARAATAEALRSR